MFMLFIIVVVAVVALFATVVDIKKGEYPLIGTVAAFAPLSPVVVFYAVVAIVIARLVIAYERREAQYKTLIASLKEVRATDVAVITGLQQQVKELLEDKADLNAELAKKDLQIAALIADRKEAEYKIDSLLKDRKSACDIADQLYRQ